MTTKIDLNELEHKLRRRVVGPRPEVTLALIARIRELESAVTEVRNDLRDGCLGQRDLDALLEKGAVLP